MLNGNGYGGMEQSGYIAKPPFVHRQRKRMNLVAMCVNLFVPWLMFTAVFTVGSFRLHQTSPYLLWGLVGLFLAVAVTLGVLAALAVQRWRAGDPDCEPKWYLFFFATSILAVVAGAFLGNTNFFLHLQPYYDLNNLNVYVGVDPAQTRGQQLMDAGRVEFARGAKLDLRKAIAFRNLDSYCVAPITFGDLPLATYDFWAVGMNCCEGDGTEQAATGPDGLLGRPNEERILRANFRCGEYADEAGRGGLRLMRDDQRAFYRLAVQQAEATYAIKANHPLFFTWDPEPSRLLSDFKEDGYKYLLMGMFAHFAFQLLLVSCSGLLMAKLVGYN